MGNPKSEKKSTLPLPVRIWEEIGNMLDFWEQLPNDVVDQLREESPGFVEAVEKIASSPQFVATK